MKLWAVAMVRNEADIIEAFVRHNLHFLDGLTVLDHRSDDGTYEILAALEAEGLPIERRRTLEPGLFKSREVSALARDCFARAGADFVFALDGDEFIRASARASLERTLNGVPTGSHVLYLWRSYVPTSFNRGFGPHCVRFRRRDEAIPRCKVVIHRSLCDRPQEMVSEGNHWVVDMARRLRGPHHAIAPDVLSLAHCPVRSASQLASKATLGYEARLVAGNGEVPPAMSFHWREIREDLASGVELDERRLRLIAMNYTVPRAQWATEEEIALVEDPLELHAVRGPHTRP